MYGNWNCIWKLIPSAAFWLNSQAIYIKGAPIISIPIAIALFFMMFPIMVKIEFVRVLESLRHIKPLLLTLFMNWIVAPLSTYGLAMLFIGLAFRGPINDNNCDAVHAGYDSVIGSPIGYGTVGCYLNGTLGTDICVWNKFQFNETYCDTNSTLTANYLVFPMWRSYVGGMILLGNAPCTAMVLVWSHLVHGNEAHALAMVAINSLLILPFYGALCMLLLGLTVFPLPWESMLLSMGIYLHSVSKHLDLKSSRRNGEIFD
jgi:ACR3 family arsenite transporter